MYKFINIIYNLQYINKLRSDIMGIEQNIKELINIELILSNNKYGKFNTTHEAYGVLIEEFTELKHEYKQIKNLIKKRYWNQACINSKITTDIEILDILNLLDEKVLNAIKELIQIGAMSKKAKVLINK
jgi:hypothetical protein